MGDESKQMHVDSLNVQVFNHQSLKDSIPVIEHAGSSGKGFPYAPEDFPSPGDVWTWRVGKRYTHAGFWQDRSVHPPDRLQSSTGNNMSFRGRVSLEQYIRKTFPDSDVDAFFASFVWKIPCTNVAKDASLKAIKSKGFSKSAAIFRTGNCKVSNEMCRMKAKTGSSLTPATCNICCTEPNFCRYCCCILCSKTIDWIYDGYSFIKCEALVDEKFICGHVAHIECALRAYLAGKVGGSIDLDAQYYCRCCDNKTDLLLHVEKIIKVSRSIDNSDDIGKVLNLGFCMLRGSEKERAEKLRNHIATSIGTTSPALPPAEFQKILDREPFTLSVGPSNLCQRFPDWCFSGVRFDYPVEPVDREEMAQSVEAVRKIADQTYQWQRLAHELQRMNKMNLQAMLTMENDKAEWEKVQKQHHDEINNIESHNIALEADVERLKNELAAANSLHVQREALLHGQITAVNEARLKAEKDLEAEQKVVASYRDDAINMASQISSQNTEIASYQKENASLKAQLDIVANERDQAFIDKREMEQSLDDTFFSLYVDCVMGKGSLSFLEDKFPITLAEVWEEVLDTLAGGDYTDEQLQDIYLDGKSRAALVEGRVQLLKKREGE